MRVNLRPLGVILLRPEILAICLYVFTADMIIGLIRPTLSLFARSLGASLTLIGALGLVLGITQISAGVIIGKLSDQQGRRMVLILGMALLGMACILYSLTPIPFLLVPIQVVLGLGVLGTITTTLAYTSDVVPPGERSLAIGVVTTVMGLGYSAGALVGGTAAGLWGYSTAYLIAAAAAVIGVITAWRLLPAAPNNTLRRDENARIPLLRQIKSMLAVPVIRSACLGTVLINLLFGGLIIAFFPIYAHAAGISQITIGSMFATRTLASTAARLPGGALGTIFTNQRVMLAALLLSTGVAFAIPQTTLPSLLTLLLVFEGIGFGLFLTSAQAALALHAEESQRGAVIGIYIASAGFGDSIVPLLLGVIADLVGISIIFYIGGGVALLGAVLMFRSFRAP